MARILRGEEEGVASAVATMFVLLLVLVVLLVAVIAVVPSQQFTAEYATSRGDLSEMQFFRTLLVGPAVEGSQFSVPFQLGTQAVSPFATATEGSLVYSSADPAGVSISFSFVPVLHQAQVRKVNQDVVLLMDDSGSMAWNDPQNLRIQGAQDYVGRLSPPDCVAIVAFNGRSYLTLTNVGGPAHHLSDPRMCGAPDYSQPISDLTTISDIDSTNIGLAIATGNLELFQNGHDGKAWVEILLTDGQNECGGSAQPCGDAYTIQQAQAAKASNITIYTIGLSSQADASLLTQIASITGGTYYPAPTASSIRWIYYEIAMHYQSAVHCSNLFYAESYGGALSLNLNSTYYPAQTLRLESGALAVVQQDGQAMWDGFPMQYASRGDGSGDLQLSVVTLTGPSFEQTGSDTHVVEGQVLGQQLVDGVQTRIDLGAEAAAVGNISANLTYWAQQGAATPAGAQAVTVPLNRSQSSLVYAQANLSRGNPVGAFFNVDQAQGSLSIAWNATETQRKAGTIQNWLAKQTEDSIRYEQCRVEQWVDWYDGVTITFTTSIPGAWAEWFNETLPLWRAPFSLGISGHTVVVTLHSLNRILTDRRAVSLSAI